MGGERNGSFLKRCYICEERKPLADFVVDERRASGVGYRCKACHAQQMRDARQRDQPDDARPRGRPPGRHGPYKPRH